MCISIDPIDEMAYCGTRSGDLLEISIPRGAYIRSGPLNRKFSGAVNQIISKFPELFSGTSEGTVAKLDKKTM